MRRLIIAGLLITLSACNSPEPAPVETSAAETPPAYAISEKQVFDIYRDNGFDFTTFDAPFHIEDSDTCTHRSSGKDQLAVCSNSAGVTKINFQSGEPFKPSPKAILAMARVMEAVEMATPITVVDVDGNVTGSRPKTAEEVEFSKLTEKDLERITRDTTGFISDRHPEIPTVEGGTSWVAIGVYRVRILSNPKWYALISDIENN